jgi:hypothetical protein
MPRPGSGTNLNIAELEQILEQRRTELNRLYKQRSEAEKKLAGIDRQIAKVEGAALGNGRRRGGGGGGTGTRVRNERPLPDVIEEVLRAGGGAMKVGEIMDGVLAAGYRSGSANFKGIVNQMLIKDRRFGQVERGVYQLKKEAK